MEKFHPYLYLMELFPGLSAYPNIVYSWLVMVFLIASSLLITKALQKIPVGGQNLFEAIFDGFSAFMEGPLGNEGRPFFPPRIHAGNLHFPVQRHRNIAGLHGPDKQPEHQRGLRAHRVFRHALRGIQEKRNGVSQAFHGAHHVAGSAYGPHRDHLTSQPSPFHSLCAFSGTSPAKNWCSAF